MHGTVLLNEAGDVIGRAIIWPDQRSGVQAREITKAVGNTHLIRLSGSPIATGFQAATVRWIMQNSPDLWRQVHKILLPKDYLRWRMTGTLATDPSDASGTLLYDISERRWSRELTDIAGIDPSLLPPVAQSEAITGRLKAGVASEFGLKSGIPVVAGAGDVACGLLGAGVTDERRLLVAISTGGQIAIPSFSPRVDELGRVHTFCSALASDKTGPGYFLLGATLSAGMSLRWLRDQVLSLSKQKGYDRMSTWAESVPAGSRGLLFLPYLAGERSPHMDPNARSMFIGLTLEHGRKEMTRAVMEGVIFACLDAYSVLSELGGKPESIIMAGGGARSRLWQQITADVFNLPVKSLLAQEQSAFGAAMLAGSGVGLLNATHASREWPKYNRIIEPDVRRNRLYLELVEIYREAYRSFRHVYS
jgi:xylulokinase